MTAVPESPVLPAAADLKVGLPPSALRVSSPSAGATNHVLGRLLGGGLKHVQRCFEANAAAGTARMRIWRHPNCDYLDVLIELETTGYAWQVDVTTGTGTTQTITDTTTSSTFGSQALYLVRAPWGAADSDDEEVTVVATDCAVRALAVYEVPRDAIDVSAGDLGIANTDSTHLQIGLIPERYVADSMEAGPPGLIYTIISGWDEGHPQHMSWWAPTASARSSSEAAYGGQGSASDLFPDLKLHFRARLKTSGQSRGTVRFWAYCWAGAGTTGELQVTATNPGPGANDSATIGGIGAAAAWYTVDVEVDCTTEATVFFELRRTAGANAVSCSAISAIGVD